MSYEPYPKSAPRACRRDAWPETAAHPGSRPRSDPRAVPRRLRHRVRHPGPARHVRPERAQPRFLRRPSRLPINDWQRDAFARPEPRLKARHRRALRGRAKPRSREIERCADDPAYAQVFMLTRTSEPLGNRRYWPIYEAAERHGLPVGMHVFGSGGHPYTGAGWPSYYIEEGAGHSTSCQTAVTSLVIEGVFERFPRLKVVIDRRRLRLAAGAVLAPRQAVRAHAQRGAAPQAQAVGIHPRAHLGHDAADGGAAGPPAAARHRWSGSAGTGCCSPPTTRTGISTIPFRAFPAGMPRERYKQILTANARAVYRLGLTLSSRALVAGIHRHDALRSPLLAGYRGQAPV